MWCPLKEPQFLECLSDEDKYTSVFFDATEKFMLCLSAKFSFTFVNKVEDGHEEGLCN